MKKRSWLVLFDERYQKKFFSAAKKIFEDFVSLNPEYNGSGGCIVIRSKTEPIIKVMHVGKLKPITFRNNSIELAKKLTDAPSCLSSTQIKEPAGAIVAEDVVLSFAGISEHGDEAIVLALAVKLSWITYEEAVAIANLSNNSLFENLHRLTLEKTPQAF